MAQRLILLVLQLFDSINVNNNLSHYHFLQQPLLSGGLKGGPEAQDAVLLLLKAI